MDGIQIETIPNSVTTLMCTTTGGPVATILWTRNCVQVPPDIYNSSTVLLDTENATYVSTLTVVGDLTGEYRCIATNGRGAAVANYSSSGHLETNSESAGIDSLQFDSLRSAVMCGKHALGQLSSDLELLTYRLGLEKLVTLKPPMQASHCLYIHR